MATRVVLMTLVFLFSAAPVAEVCAQSAPTPGAKAAPDPREGALRVRVTQWMSARELLIVKCSKCDGFGYDVVESAAGSAARQTCPSCSGDKYKVSPTQAEKAFYNYRSPAWRARPASRSEFNEEFGELELEDAWAFAPKVSRFEGAEFVDDTHAVARVVEGEGGAAVESRWILVTEGKGKPQWFCWMEEADGPWPEAQAAAVAPGPVAPIAALPSALPAGSTWLGSETTANSDTALAVIMRVVSVDESEATCVAWYPDFNQGLKEIVLALEDDGSLSVSGSSVLYGEAEELKAGLVPAQVGTMHVSGSALTGRYAFTEGKASVTAKWALTRVGG